MPLMTGEQYIESIRAMHMNVYMFGKKVECPVDDPILRPSLNSVRMTYDLAQMPEYQDLMTAVSPYTGRQVNRFTHIHQSPSDLVKKSEDAAPAGAEDRRLLPAVRGYGRLQRRVLHLL